MKSLILAILLGLASWFAQAQSAEWAALSTDDREVMKVIVDIFEGMREGDSARVKGHFYEHTTANTTYIDDAGQPQLRTLDITKWFEAIGAPHEQILDERLWNYQIQRDGNLATVWVEYAFYLGEEFHHCGADAFQLAHDGQHWRIFHLADTRRTDPCEIPSHIANGAKY